MEQLTSKHMFYEMGKKNNQTFCSILHTCLSEMLTYKAELVGIKVVLTEESYTSQTSFLDRDTIFSDEELRNPYYKSQGDACLCFSV